MSQLFGRSPLDLAGGGVQFNPIGTPGPLFGVRPELLTEDPASQFLLGLLPQAFESGDPLRGEITPFGKGRLPVLLRKAIKGGKELEILSAIDQGGTINVVFGPASRVTKSDLKELFKGFDVSVIQTRPSPVLGPGRQTFKVDFFDPKSPGRLDFSASKRALEERLGGRQQLIRKRKPGEPPPVRR